MVCPHPPTFGDHEHDLWTAQKSFHCLLRTAMSPTREMSLCIRRQQIVGNTQGQPPDPPSLILPDCQPVIQAVAALPLLDHLKRDSFGQVQVSFHKSDGGVSPRFDHKSHDDPVIIASTISTTSMQFENGGSTFEPLLETSPTLLTHALLLDSFIDSGNASTEHHPVSTILHLQSPALPRRPVQRVFRRLN